MQATVLGESWRKIMVPIFAGLIIRELFSFWTGHPTDFELWVRLGYAMNHGGDPYGVLSSVPGLSFADVFGNLNEPTVAYLPFWPLLTGIIYALYSLIGANNRFLYYFLLKQPAIFGDIGLAYLLFSYVHSRKPDLTSFSTLFFWLFSPFTIILSGIWGMFDAIAICFVIASAMSHHQVKKSLYIGLGIFVKSIPVIYAAPITVKRLKSMLGLIGALGLPTLLSLVTFVIMKWPISIVSLTLASTAGKGGSSMSVWDVFFYLNNLGLIRDLTPLEYRTLGILWIPALIVFTWIAVKRFRTETDYGLIQALIVCTLIFLIFKSRVTEQYALYLFALAAIDVALWNPKRKALLLGTMSVVMVYLVVNNYFLVRFLSPVYPGFANFENYLYGMIGSTRNAINFLSGTAFTCLNIKYLVDVLRTG